MIHYATANVHGLSISKILNKVLVISRYVLSVVIHSISVIRIIRCRNAFLV